MKRNPGAFSHNLKHPRIPLALHPDYLEHNVVHHKITTVAYLLILSDILDQHLEEAAMLSARRMLAVRGPVYRLDSLANLDRRIEAHLEGLCVDADSACALKFEDVGEAFVGAYVALASCEHARFDRVLEAACAAPELMVGVTAALGWLPYTRIVPVIEKLMTSSVPEYRAIAVAAQAIHRVGGDWLQKALNDQSVLLQTHACHAVGELGRVDLLQQVQSLVLSKDEAVAFWSCWSAAVLGDGSSATLLKRFATVPDYADDALSVGLRRLPQHAAKAWIEELAQNEANVRSVIQGVGIVGDPAFVPGLIGMMSVKDLARVAAESFCAITGVNLAEQKLEALAPAPANEEEETAIDPDEFLPWPDAACVSAWWDKNAARFSAGTRYLLGKPVTPEHLQWVLRYGNQKLRHGAALELAMLAPGTPVFNTAAPAWIQQKLLGLAG